MTTPLLAAFAAVVVSVGDGDTLRVRPSPTAQPLTIRLACIDAPERRQAPHGANAAAALRLLAPVGASVRVQPHSTDRYGRTVAEVGTINRAMVAAGHAFAYRRYLARCDRAAYLAAEAAAQQQRLGVWAVPGGITRPWDFRRGVR